MDVISSVRAADTCLRILQQIAFAEQPQGVTQIAGKVGIAKGAVHKHLRTLIDHGMIVQDPTTSLYRLGPKIWLMGQKAPDGQMLSEIALPLMQAVRDDLGLAVVLSVPTPKSAFVLATLRSNQPIDIGVRPGSELQLHSSAQGKVFLAFGPADLWNQLQTPLEAVTPRTTTDVETLRRDIDRIRQAGYAVAPEESLLGINALAAPIFSATGAMVGSIGLIGSIQHLSADATPHQLKVLLDLTEAISHRI
ncbi:IclR family transcriptional regulator [Paracoccus sediminis]|uniref:IclR family transcriptional regulator n=1 Tax=Paracoccus sediminis TaxID=1214787 RepID=A0A238XV10_9RHOB|nr:IclR family transcriptional regulator [Paracoccus sediminis]SNR61839.1 transcriptional regulator, IclR family [Paracoccus sediminis]